MAPSKFSADVLDIQLVEFIYNPEYDFDKLHEVDIKVIVLTRAPPDKDQFDVMVKIAYHNKATAEPVLTTSCVTNYALTGMPKGMLPETGESTVDIPAHLIHLMKIEAVAHARALIATQAASTPFGKTYVSLGMRTITQMLREEIEEVITKTQEPKEAQAKKRIKK